MPDKVITLVKYNQWFIPSDTQSYNELRALGLGMTQMHEDMLGLLKLQCQKKGIILKGRMFKTVLGDFQSSVEKAWSKQHRVAVMNQGRWIFRANKTAYAKAKSKSVVRLEQKLQEFFERWGISSEFTFTENEGKSLKLVVDFKKRTNIPLIPVDDLPEDQECALTMNNHRLVISQDRRFVYYKFQTKKGSEWAEVVSSRSRHEDVSDPSLFIGQLIQSYSK